MNADRTAALLAEQRTRIVAEVLAEIDEAGSDADDWDGPGMHADMLREALERRGYALREAAAQPVAGPQEVLDTIRDEVREAVLEGDAQDCSSADCIADAVYEIVRSKFAALHADAPGPLDAAHKPGGPHEYALSCKVCGEPGTVRLSIDPQWADKDQRLPLLGLSDEQTNILRGHLASRQQSVSEFLGDVLMEYGLGRATGKEYAPPMSAAQPEQSTEDGK
jgi:hypothetical protein